MNQIVFVMLVTLATVTVQEGGMNPEKGKEMEKHLTDCIASEKASIADGEMYKKHQLPTTQEGKCLIGCMLEKCGALQNGVFDKATAEAKAKQNMADDAKMLTGILAGYDACAKEVSGKDKCVTGPQLFQCMAKYMPQPPK